MLDQINIGTSVLTSDWLCIFFNTTFFKGTSELGGIEFSPVCIGWVVMVLL